MSYFPTVGLSAADRARSAVGNYYRSDAGNTWECVDSRGDRVCVRLHSSRLGGPTGETFWWHLSSLVGAAGMTWLGDNPPRD